MKSRALLAGVANGALITLAPMWWQWVFGASNSTTVTPDGVSLISPAYGLAACLGLLTCFGTAWFADGYLHRQPGIRLGRAPIIAMIPAAMVAVLLARSAAAAPVSYFATYVLIAFGCASAVLAVLAAITLAVLYLTGPVPAPMRSGE